jgi:hypothetical protein
VAARGTRTAASPNATDWGVDGLCIVARIIVQPLRKGGYGFNIKTNPYSWLTLHYETKEAAEEGRTHALRATEKATLK